jgi:hypothetical protein
MRNTDIPQDAVSSQEEPYRKTTATPGPLRISELGWSTEEVKETRDRLAAFEEDWDAPGMEAYDHL